MVYLQIVIPASEPETRFRYSYPGCDTMTMNNTTVSATPTAGPAWADEVFLPSKIENRARHEPHPIEVISTPPLYNTSWLPDESVH